MVAVGPIDIASGGGGGRGALGEGGRRHPQGLLVISISNFSTIIASIVTTIPWSRRNTTSVKGLLVFSLSIIIFIFKFIQRLRKQRDRKRANNCIALIVNQNENVPGLVLSTR